jgi:hypothetical protein
MGAAGFGEVLFDHDFVVFVNGYQPRVEGAVDVGGKQWNSKPDWFIRLKTLQQNSTIYVAYIYYICDNKHVYK